MNIAANINQLRRSIMRKLTRNIGVANVIPSTNDNEPIQIKRILVSRPNKRLGNLLLITPLVQELMHHFPDARIDMFTRGSVGKSIFKNYTATERIIKLPKEPFKHLIDYMIGWIKLRKYRYDLVVNVIYNSSSGRLSTKFASSKFKIFGDIEDDVKETYNDHEHVAKYPVYNLRKYLRLAGYNITERPVPVLDVKLRENEKQQGKKLLKELVNNHKKTICLFTFATGTKLYPEEWWAKFYDRLRYEFPMHNIVEVLPVENVSQLAFSIPSFYSSNIREAGAFIAAADVCIAADSGIMHLASAVHTPTIGLFRVTNPATFGPYGGENLAINTNQYTIDELLCFIHHILCEGEMPIQSMPFAKRKSTCEKAN